MEYRYNKLSDFLKEKYGEKVLKICVDAGFTCPNRDGKCGYGGCIFCGEHGSGDLIKNRCRKVGEQVKLHLASYKGHRANKFILYFQNFTNTYGSVEELKQIYNSGLVSDKIVALAIATRPDEIDEQKAKLISQYMDKYFVWVELGLQTSNDITAKFINRGYTSDTFTKAVNILNKYNIPVVVHMMVGLPNESFIDIKNTVNFINNHDIWGIKVHNVYVTKDCVLNTMYQDGKYQPLELEEYLSYVGYIVSHIRPDIIVHKLSGDAPINTLVAPMWDSHKKWIMNGIDKYLENNNILQGCKYNNKIK